ncbi:hypothetical protein BH09PAT4_BH09PAT4_06530 [soil metagenome]
MSTPNETYNGWTNRETWLVNMWLNADRGHYSALMDICDMFETVSEQADEIKRWVIASEQWTNGEENQVGLWRDLVYTALVHVNWREIAKASQS